ncbi:DegV family EDD domain-containing protein [Alcanivorax sp. VBW004]|uniref:DegV family protein n=1 Tax=Alcanivorax sp. VBW004 TaxID=1287708 RepID=UPI0012BD2C7F|nr:DegV family protein [Alcanivorax sp. VBW004]MTT51236.1 DegV family EDD domain-containing protein [Alcanivorax sp. VBW004]
MQIGLVVDATCDLPKHYIDQHQIQVLPISIRIGDAVFVDSRDPKQRQDFYADNRLDKGQDAESVPLDTDAFRQFFLDRIVSQYDYALVQTLPASRSPMFNNATRASHGILRDYKAVRAEAGVEGPFALRVTDSQTLFCGQAVLAAATINMIGKGMRVSAVRNRVNALIPFTSGYSVVDDLYYVQKRARKKGDKSVSWLSAKLGSTLDIKPILCARAGESFPADKVRGYPAAVEKMFTHACDCIRQGLLEPVVCVSYAGDENRIAELPGFRELKLCAKQHGVELLSTGMSLTGGVNLGPGAVNVGFISETTTFS